MNLNKVIANAVRVSEHLSFCDWSEQKRILQAKSSAEPGRLRLSRTPYMRKIFESLDPANPAERVVFMKSTQVGATEAGVTWAGYVIDQNPCSMMIVQPTVDLAKRYSKQRLQPMIDDMPILQTKMEKVTSRSASNTQTFKDFLGGVMVMSGANSAASLRSAPVRILFLDEVDAYPEDCDGEGDPVVIALRRTDAFYNRKIFICSTPTDQLNSKVEREFKNSNRQYFHVPCPICDTPQVLNFEHLIYETDKDDKYQLDSPVRYVCSGCGAEIAEERKNEMMQKGEWISENPKLDGVYEGFHINGLYSPPGWLSWSAIVDTYLKAEKTKNPLKKKEFTNTILGRTWQSTKEKKVSQREMMARREDYTLVPNNAVLVSGVDCQDDRLEIETVAYSRNFESHGMGYRVFMGDPARPEVWKDLDDFLKKDWKREDGSKTKIACTCVDSGGHHTQTVYDWCNDRTNRRVYAVNGAAQKTRPIITRPSKLDKYRGIFFSVGVHIAKIRLFTALAIKEHGAGFCHYNKSYGNDYFKQLASETLVETVNKRGFVESSWKLTAGRRNEAIDLRTYSIAALEIIKPDFDIIEQKAKKRAENAGKVRQTKKKAKKISKYVHGG